MTEIKELVAVIVDMEGNHDDTCVWCNKDEDENPDEGELDESDIEEDVEELAKNDGGKLGTNMANEAGGTKRCPENMKVSLGFDEKASIDVDVKGELKQVAVYEGSDPREYDVVFAAHHLIPGNAALKGHDIVKWIGGDDKIEKGKRKGKPAASMINDGEFCGYNINNQENGVWLPGPYAMSTAKKWPSNNVMKVAKKVGALSVADARTNQDFKRKYAYAVIDQALAAAEAEGIKGKALSYIGSQFHFSHNPYSRFVKKCLRKVCEKITRVLIPVCPEANDENKQKDGKYPVPQGMSMRLNGISRRLEPYLSGKPWSKNIYTDNYSKDYVDEQLKKTQS